MASCTQMMEMLESKVTEKIEILKFLVEELKLRIMDLEKKSNPPHEGEGKET